MNDSTEATVSFERRAAIHESGHAMVGHLLRLCGGRPVVHVSIIPDETSHGRVVFGKHPQVDDEEQFVQSMVMDITIALAGVAAETLAFHEFPEKNSIRGDVRYAEALASGLKRTQEEVNQLGVDCFKNAANILKRHWKAVLALADYLLERKKCYVSTLQRIIADNPGSYERSKEQ